MASKIKIIIIIFLAIILEISFFPGLSFWKIMPDVSLVLIILWSFRKKFEEIWFWAFFCGMLLDVAVFGKIGISASSFVLISFGVSFLRERFFIAQRAGSFFIALGLVVGGTILNWIWLSWVHDFSGIFFWEQLATKIISNLAVAVFLYFAILKFKEIFGISENKLTMK